VQTSLLFGPRCAGADTRLCCFGISVLRNFGISVLLNWLSLLQALEAEVQTLQGTVSTLEEQLSKSRQEEQHLHDSLAQVDTEQRRNSVNIEYLKNILVRFMAFDLKSSERRSLTVAIATMLEFTPEEMKVTCPPASGVWWRKLGG
jgi:septal ring factor EnvC (AmiA/AmiB activator)